MSCRGVYFALTDEEEQKLLSAAGDDEAVIEIIQEEIEDRWDEEWLEETDKAWDAMHRCLTDGTLSFSGKTDLHKCVLGGRQLHQGDGYIVSYLTREEVKTVAKAIAPLGEDRIRERYFGISEEDYGYPLSEEDFEYTWENIRSTQQFFAKASAANRPVVFSVDQ